MSRDVHHQQPAIPIAAETRRHSVSSSSTLTDLDDRGYSDLEGMADDNDDDEEDVEAVEAEYMISHENQNSPRPVESDEEGDDEDEPDDDQDAESDSDEDDVLLSVLEAKDRRHVHWDIPESDEGDTTSDEDGYDADQLFPDIFLPQSQLDPAFRRALEADDTDSSSSSSTYWVQYDFEDFFDDPKPKNDEAHPVPPVTVHSPDMKLGENFGLDGGISMGNPLGDLDASPALSTPIPSPDDDGASEGYESDYEGGDTTEEEDPPEPIRRKPPQEAIVENSDPEGVEWIRPRRGKPGVTLEKLDFSGKKKPFAILNKKTGKLMIFTSQSEFDLSPGQLSWDPNGISYVESLDSQAPFLGNGGNLMGAMVSTGTFADILNSQSAGLPEAIFQVDGAAIEDDSEEMGEAEAEDDNDKDEAYLDFLHFSESEEDVDQVNGDDEEGEVYETTPHRPATTHSDLDHLFENGKTKASVVGSFRRDQVNSQLIRNGKATRESLGFNNPYYEGTLRGIKDGRIAETNTPITPLRKQKKAIEMHSSALAGASPKRKAPFQQQNGDHKRQRSIMSDMNLPQL